MVADYSMRNHGDYVSRSHAITSSLIAAVVVAIAALATEMFPQSGSSPFVTRDLSVQSTISANQLLTPKKALQAVESARNHLLAGHVDQAQKEVARALEISPHCALALTLRGLIQIEERQFGDAGVDFQDALEADPALGAAYLGLAMSLIGQRRLRNALVPLDRATSLLPGSWLVYYEAAIAHLGLGDADAALTQINYAERFTKMDPEKKSGTAYVRGIAYMDLADYDRAKKHLEDSVAFDPNGPYSILARRRLEQFRPILVNSK